MASVHETSAPPVAPAHGAAVLDGGWLFRLEEERRRTVPTEEELDLIVADLSSAAHACGELGIVYIPALIPAKREAVNGAQTGGRKGRFALRAKLRKEDDVELLDLLGVLRDAARGGSPYHRSDADWNGRGAFFVARALLKEARKRVPALCPPALADLHVRVVPEYRGTLADAPKLRAEGEGFVECEAAVQAEPGIELDPSRVQALRMPVEQHLADGGDAPMRVYATPEHEVQVGIAVIGDAAALSLVPWVARCASRTTFFQTRCLPLAQLELERPCVVLHLLRERDLAHAFLPDE
jgi:hypothetical protein